jgi:hypothetical protein
MVPAIMFAYSRALYLISAGLFLSMFASMVYHLCDTDYYCLFGLSFLSLQVFDILFSNVMIASVLVLFSPLPQSTHDSVVLVVFGVLLSLTVNFPTNPLNIFLSFFIACLVNAGGWLYYYCYQKNYISAIIRPLSLSDRSERGKIGFSSISEDQQMSTMDFYQTNPQPDGRSTVLGGDVGTSSLSSYHPIAQNDHSITRPNRETLSDMEDNGSIEMVARADNSEAPDSISNMGPESSRQGSVIPIGWIAMVLFRLKFLITGIVFGVAGLLCFATQTRLNYWLSHSLWHIFIMFSSLLLLKGRFEFFALLNYQGNEPNNRFR